MNQYIITEELLKQFEKACPRYSTTPDHFIIDRDTMVAEVRSNPYNPQAERDCPVCGGGLMCHRWCIDRDCNWDSVKDMRQKEGGK